MRGDLKYIVASLIAVFLFSTSAMAKPEEISNVDWLRTVSIAKYSRRTRGDLYITCSGVLVDPTTIYTASHCIQVCDRVDRNRGEACDLRAEPGDYAIVTGPGTPWGNFKLKDGDIAGNSKNKIHQIESMSPNLNYKNPETYEFKYDVAVIKLKQPVDFLPQERISILPKEYLKNISTSKSLKGFYSIGYGNRIDRTTGDKIQFGEKDSHLFFDIKGEKPRYTFSISKNKFELEILDSENNNGGCKGDSGGPVFAVYDEVGKDGQLVEKSYLISLVTNTDYFKYKHPQGSHSKAKCGAPSRSTLIGYHSEWLDFSLGLKRAPSIVEPNSGYFHVCPGFEDEVEEEKAKSRRSRIREKNIASAIDQLNDDANYSEIVDEHSLNEKSFSNTDVKWAYYKALQKTIPESTYNGLIPMFEELKDSVKRAVNEDRGFSSMGRDLHISAIRKIDEIQLERFDLFLKRDMDEQLYPWMGWKNRGHHLEMACGQMGVVRSAFYYEEENIVVICPGAIMDRANGDIPSWNDLSFLLAHEISHSVDYDYLPEAHSSLINGLSDGGFEEPFWKEMSADSLAAKAFFYYQKEEQYISKSAKSNLSLFCELPRVEDGSMVYPGSLIRVSHILNTIGRAGISDVAPHFVGNDKNF